ncbi:glycerophosphoryl diester phosphodiesterase [Scopulibacillus darangshiensis]|uniref:Glycerophosphoryl diester phosphodiesterase n=1 Tax=Scopulibacillus darangshiensis TaxID=442528 RepID=A0A4R2NRV6_9BACL|nr:glycerophosphodiester phosphodiesterase family protein [Scopulibacillus darangshiensis]TCP24085.1 glycerophosphoryl diester phosphodiesterase [Scopulibacillus darangshiensis]
MTIYFAHRGSVTEAPENTLSSFQKALTHGAKFLELDVQLTKDNELIVCHDQRLDRVAKNKKGLIKDFTLAEIKEIDVGSSFSKEYEGEPLATLSEILDICPSEVFLNIEIKNIPIVYEGIEKRVLDCVGHHRTTDQFMVSSFDHLALKRVEVLDPSVKLGLLSMDRLIEPWHYAENCGLNIYSLHPRHVFVDKEYIRESHAAGYKVYPWTVDKFDELDRLLKLDVDGVITNNPEMFGSK